MSTTTVRLFTAAMLVAGATMVASCQRGSESSDTADSAEGGERYTYHATVNATTAESTAGVFAIDAHLSVGGYGVVALTIGTEQPWGVLVVAEECGKNLCFFSADRKVSLELIATSPTTAQLKSFVYGSWSVFPGTSAAVDERVAPATTPATEAPSPIGQMPKCKDPFC